MSAYLLLDPSGRELPVTFPERVPEARELQRAEPLVKITRSFTFKLNLGNYESADFFTSQTAECPSSMASEVSLGLYEWCEEQTMKAVMDVKRRRQEKWTKAS